MKTAKTLSWLVALVGVWLGLSPFVLGFPDALVPLWNAVIIAIALVVLGVWAAQSQTLLTLRILNWINVVLGVWLILSPFILFYSGVTAATWNAIIVGIVAVVLAAWAALVGVGTDQHHPQPA